MSEENWKENLKNIWNALEYYPMWGIKKWDSLKDDFQTKKQEWDKEWKNIKDVLKSVDKYYKKDDVNSQSLVRWIDKNFHGSYGMSDKPCSLFGKEKGYTIDDALNDEKNGSLEIKKYSSFFDECLNKTKENIDEYVENELKKTGKEKFFSAKGFLRKLIIANNYFNDKFEYACLYKEEKINPLYKMMAGKDIEKADVEKDFFKRNAVVFKEAKEIVAHDFKTVDENIRLSIALDVLIDGTSFKELPTESQPNVIYYGAPGTGKTYTVKKIIDLACQGDSNRYVWTQFHPNFSYEDFIDGIKPVGIDEKGNVKLELLNGVFKDLCIRARNDINHEYYFVADEINRANLSAVFGETLSLLEASYRDDPTKENRNNLIKTQYSKIETKLIETNSIDGENAYEYDEIQGAMFGIPKNIRFIGMMNDVDKSIDAFDLALRRRFKWIRKDCDYDVIQKVLECEIEGESLKDYIKSCKSLNNFISEKGLKLGKSYEFGHSFFMKIGEIVKNNEKNDAETITEGNKENLFDNYLAPTLKEYLRSSCSEEEIDGKLNEAKKAYINEVKMQQQSSAEIKPETSGDA